MTFAFLTALTASAVVCFAILRSAGWHLHITADRPGEGPQKFHTEPTPRIGGLGILGGIVVASLVAGPTGDEPAKYWFLILCLLPAFLAGFIEDITRKVPPWTRLLATAVTAGAAWALVEVRFFRSDVQWLDLAFSYLPFAYAGLLLAVAGVAHAMNIIDGYNGLSGGVGTIILLALGAVATQHDDLLVAGACFTAAGAIAGFLLFNYPAGRIFLGDGGAYLLGCVIAIAAAMLVQRNPQVSPWFPFALVIYPIWETLFSIIRRRTLQASAASQADAWHLHSLVYRRLAHRWIRRRDATGTMLQNAVTTLPFWAMTVLVAVLAYELHDSTAALQLLSLLFVVMYVPVYFELSRLKRPVSRAVAAYVARRKQRKNRDVHAFSRKA